MDEEPLHLSLPGLLPPHHILVVDAKTHMASLLSIGTGTASIRTQVQFSAKGIAVLTPLLLSYPQDCPYEHLASCLFPLSVERCREMIQGTQSERDLLLKPVRRTVTGLAPGLQELGMKAHSIRNVGYVLKRASAGPFASP